MILDAHEPTTKQVSLVKAITLCRCWRKTVEGSRIAPHCNSPYAEVLKEYSKNMKRSVFSVQRSGADLFRSVCREVSALISLLLSLPLASTLSSRRPSREECNRRRLRENLKYSHTPSLSLIHTHREPILAHTFSPDAGMRPFYLASFSTHLKKTTQPTWLTLEHTRPINIYLLIVPWASPMHSLQWSACSI